MKKISKENIKKRLKKISEISEEFEQEKELEKLEEKTGYNKTGFKKYINKLLKEKEKQKKENEEIENKKTKKAIYDLQKLEKKKKKELKIKSYAGDNELSRRILEILLDPEGDYNEATELMVEDILKNEKIASLRSDIKPEIWIYNEGIFIPEGASYVQERCRLILGKAFSKTFFRNVLDKIISDTFVDEKVFFEEADKKYIAVNNGILNLENLEHLKFNPDLKFFSKLPVDFNPEIKCPKILKFLKSILKSEEDLKIIQELIGFLLIRDYFIEKAIMLIGEGRNGKSKFLDLIKCFLGFDNCVEIPLQDLEKDNFALSELHKKLVNISGDLSDEGLENTGNFKKLTGRDFISAARKYLKRIKFINYAKQVFACNQLPKTEDFSPAFFLRWILIEFPFTFLPEKEIKNIPEDKIKNIKLQNPHIIDDIISDEELSGLLNWALIGLKRLQEQKDFSYSKTMDEVKNNWLRKSNSMEGFVLDCCKFEYNQWVLKEEISLEYCKYCSEHKLRIENERVIKNTLERFGVYGSRKYISDGTLYGKEFKHIWMGVRLK